MGCGASTLKGYENRDDLNPRPIHQVEVSTKSSFPHLNNSGNTDHQFTTYSSDSAGQDPEPRKKKEPYHDYQNHEVAEPAKHKEMGEAGPREKTKKELKAEAKARIAGRQKNRMGAEAKRSYENAANYSFLGFN